MLQMLNGAAADLFYLGANSGRGPSPRIWASIWKSLMTSDGSSGLMIGDDFGRFQGMSLDASGVPNTSPAVDAASETTAHLAVGGVDGYAMYLDSTTTGCGITRLASAGRPGVARLTANTTDNHLAIMHAGELGNLLSFTAGSRRKTAFEFSVRLPTQVTTGSTLIGLGTTSIAADGGLIVDTGEVLATAGFVGFRTLDADPDGFDAIYQDASQTPVVVNNDFADVVATGWGKFGGVYDPLEPDVSRILKFFYNGTELSSAISSTTMLLSTFPNDIYLGPVAAVKSDGGSVARSLDIDWWVAYQEFDGH